jgi:hypothetical protein
MCNFFSCKWPRTCLSKGVLRITLPLRADNPLFVLEGRLAGLWVKELLRVTRELGPRTNSVFDIEEVCYVDPLGEETLCWLNKLGATFIVENVYGKDICHRLRLRRVPAVKSGALSHRKPRSGKSPPDTPCSSS